MTEDRAALTRCSLIVAASNSPEPLVHPRHLGRGPVVICDISVPSDVAGAVALERPDVHVIRGGVVRLPLDPTFEIGGISLPPGHSLACMAETLLMGLEGATNHWSVGPVTADGVACIDGAARRHDFQVAELTPRSVQVVNRFFDDLRGRERIPDLVGVGRMPTVAMTGA